MVPLIVRTYTARRLRLNAASHKDRQQQDGEEENNS